MAPFLSNILINQYYWWQGWSEGRHQRKCICVRWPVFSIARL